VAPGLGSTRVRPWRPKTRQCRVPVAVFCQARGARRDSLPAPPPLSSALAHARDSGTITHVVEGLGNSR